MKIRTLLNALAMGATLSGSFASAQTLYPESYSDIDNSVEGEIIYSHAEDMEPIGGEGYASSDLVRRLEALENHTYLSQGETRLFRSWMPGVGDAGFFGSADYLYWSVRDKNMEYGIAGDRTQQDDGARGDILTLSDQWDSGIRGMVGYRLGCGGPDIRVRYSGFAQDLADVYDGNLRATMVSSDNAEEDDIDNINTLGNQTVFPEDLATRAEALYSLEYNTFDAEFGQMFRINDVLDIRLHSGARVAKIDELQQVIYSGGDFDSPYLARQQYDSLGAGMYLGGNLNWNLTNHLTLDSGLNGGLLLTSFESNSFFADEDDLANADGPTSVSEQETRLIPFLELNAGLTHHMNIFGCGLQTSVGYQFVTYLGASESRTFSDMYQEGQNVRVRDNLSLDGAYARIGFDY